jgi:hypothetical protein
MTVTDRRISGRTSAAIVPSARAINTTSCSAARPAITCTTRGSLALARRSTFSSSATLALLSMVPIGSRPGYSERDFDTLTVGTRTLRPWPCAEIDRTVWAASISESHERSSE